MDRLADRRPELHVDQYKDRISDAASTVAETVAGGSRDAARRVLESTDRATRTARGTALDRSRAVAAALRGEQPPRRWPVALVSLGVGLGVGVLVGWAVARRLPEEEANAPLAEEERDGYVPNYRSAPQPAPRPGNP